MIISFRLAILGFMFIHPSEMPSPIRILPEGRSVTPKRPIGTVNIPREAQKGIMELIFYRASVWLRCAVLHRSRVTQVTGKGARANGNMKRFRVA